MQNTEFELLTTINSPADLKKLSINQLPQVCSELRQFIINELSHNPGHLGASLGTVELTVALHYVLNTPEDRVVWDVGHQAYGHKILTERREAFSTNRKYKGLCGFPNPSESIYDSFISGHASNSISAALGLDVASVEQGIKRHVVAVIGDGALSGGLAFEGLNNASSSPNNLLIILNDNHMAIDPIFGGMSQYLLDITTSKTYNKIRYRAFQIMRKLGLISDNKKARLQRFSNSVKSALAHHENNIFDGMNVRYFGPIDGHNVIDLVRILQEIKDFEGPKVVHCLTKKGKGYKPAEEFATVWHAPGLFDVESGRRFVKSDEHKPPLFQEVFGHTILELAKENDKIVGVTPAMPSGCSLNIMIKEMPKRCFDVGIAEGHAVTFSAGLAKEGLIPFCNIYSSFMQRAYDNIIHDVALQNLPVIFCLDRAGIVGADGATHHGMFDLAYLRPIPNITVASPYDEMELRNMMYTAQLNKKGAFAIRYPRGRGFNENWRTPFEEITIGTGRCLKEGSTIAVLTLGPIGHSVKDAIEALEQKQNVSIAHYDMRFLKPLDETLLREIAKKFSVIVTVEDGVRNGGFGSAITDFFVDENIAVTLKCIAYPNRFIDHGTPMELYHEIGMDASGIEQKLQQIINAL